ncbi:MAG: hypothetical protein KAT68_02090 [Bacteroidales bacterium]|nr:hypothetical protein [Bacteroidales bacterium]
MKTRLVIIIVFILSFNNVKSQEKVYLPYFEAINIHSGYQYSATKLFKTYLINYNNYIVMIDDTSAAKHTNYNVEKLREKAKSLNTDYFIIGELNSLGEKIIVSIVMYKTDDGSKYWNDILKAKNPDDLDPVLQRLANSIGKDENASESGDIYNVSEYESKELERYKANKNFGILIGGSYTIMDKVDENFSPGMGMFLSYDARNLILDIKVEGYFKDIKLYQIALDAAYPLKNTRSTPFIGGGLGYSGTTADKEKKLPSGYSHNYYDYDYDYYEYRDYGGGIMLRANGGYIFNRNSNVNLRFSATGFMNLYKIHGQYPVGIIFNMAIIFN